jgi:rod shape-determining protein MreD
MRFLRFATALLAVVLLHVLGVWLIPEFARVMDLFLVLTVLYAMGGDTLSGMFVGLVAGLCHDVLTGGLFALHGFADTLVGYGLARLAQRLVIDQVSGAFLVAGVAAAVQQVLLAGLVLMLLPAPELPEPVWIAIRAAATGAAAAAVLLASRNLREGLAEHRHRRAQRLHLD